MSRSRLLHPLRGIRRDLHRRAPWLKSDFIDGFTFRTLPTTIRILSINLLPALAFELDLLRHSGGYFGISEALFSSALAALVFSLFSCQPLTIVGITGLISLFNATVYEILRTLEVGMLYPQFMGWVALWAAAMHIAVAVGNLCDYMRYVTDFSTHTFGMYVGVIYVIKGFGELVALFREGDATASWCGVFVAGGFWGLVAFLEGVRGTCLGTEGVRKAIADFAYPIATIWWTGFSYIPGVRGVGVERLPLARAFKPTVERNWVVEFWELPVKWVFVAMPMGVLLTLLFYYDHNVSSLTAQAKGFPLRKPAGFHWDFFLLGITCLIAGVFGLPLPNGLVPQAPVHTDACTEYEDCLVQALSRPLPDDYGRDTSSEIVNTKVTKATRVHEQRISHLAMGLCFIVFMTGLFLRLLHFIPRAVFAGVFLVVGWGSISSMNITDNLLFVFTETRFISPSDPRLELKRLRILYYTAWQVVGVVACVAISQTIAAIGFPVIITALIPLRWVVLPKVFSERELEVLDSLTADADVVLESLGGRPGENNRNV
ncbi:hypothetical protein K470DRAFT_280677 [Piedraia hortae CBS 480.64]|uniref:Bicarbonate transporter-like transmembrane domain-containing protein n=1 Tax=Piedraia hortae CBS 480.64 TaxID=1314780 RepID=A0A6A7C7U1_9PEZI|nr:hypothetical protein K470DRAFT_280677 [Piedraia hortae CBS 480.64]